MSVFAKVGLEPHRVATNQVSFGTFLTLPQKRQMKPCKFRHSCGVTERRLITFLTSAVLATAIPI